MALVTANKINFAKQRAHPRTHPLVTSRTSDITAPAARICKLALARLAGEGGGAPIGPRPRILLGRLRCASTNFPLQTPVDIGSPLYAGKSATAYFGSSGGAGPAARRPSRSSIKYYGGGGGGGGGAPVYDSKGARIGAFLRAASGVWC